MQVWEILDGSYTGGGRSGISAMFAHLVDGNHHVRWYATRGRVKHVELARGTILVDQGPALRVRSDPDVTHFSLRLCLGWRRPDRLRSFQQASRRAATPMKWMSWDWTRVVFPQSACASAAVLDGPP